MNRILATLALAAAMAQAAAAVAQTAPTPAPKPAATAKATFAGGCFWCMEPPYDKLDGVVATISGYIGGQKPNPTYQEVTTGRTGHTEAVEVEYDPNKVSYEKLLEVFWKNIDPTQKDGQFCDHGSQYRSGIFVHNDEQRRLADASKSARFSVGTSSVNEASSPTPNARAKAASAAFEKEAASSFSPAMNNGFGNGPTWIRLTSALTLAKSGVRHSPF